MRLDSAPQGEAGLPGTALLEVPAGKITQKYTQKHGKNTKKTWENGLKT
jgi:hypothetical protein